MNVRARNRDQLVEEALAFARGTAAPKPAEPDKNIESDELLNRKRSDSDFMISERGEFRKRVIEFRASQQKRKQVRERYYDETWFEICSALILLFF